MSAIGSFYLIADEKRDDIVRAAEAQSTALKKKRFGFLPPKFPLNPDPFWEFVRANTEELDQYPYCYYPGFCEAPEEVAGFRFARQDRYTQHRLIGSR